MTESQAERIANALLAIAMALEKIEATARLSHIERQKKQEKHFDRALGLYQELSKKLEPRDPADDVIRVESEGLRGTRLKR